jgi:hypothetical protein
MTGRDADRFILKASLGPLRKLGPGSHTGGPETSAPKKYFFINLVPISIYIYIYLFMK